MPEIAEAARIVHFLRNHLVGKKIKNAVAIDDSSVFGKVGTTGAEFAASVKGKKVVSAGRQGKYFWLVLDSPPHPVMHFGMTGWIHIKGERTGYTNYYNKLKPGEADLWPPKYWKFQLETEASPSKVEVAFTDPRRFGRVRLVDCPGESIRKFSPLVENGPDPVVDADTTFNEDYVLATMRKRHVPIKALLLDQAFISGIGNWVGDEVLFHARLHPEQYCDEFTDAQMKKLYASICHICRTAVDLLGDSDQFPDNWLFHYRWGKGSKSAVAQLPSGEKLSFLTVGGRTSCFAPNLQKKSGNVVPGIKEEPVVIKPEKATKKTPKAAAPAATEATDATTKKRKRGAAKETAQEDIKEDVETPKAAKPVKKGKTSTTANQAKSTSAANGTKTKEIKQATKVRPAVKEETTTRSGRRRSARLGGN